MRSVDDVAGALSTMLRLGMRGASHAPVAARPAQAPRACNTPQRHERRAMPALWGPMLLAAALTSGCANWTLWPFGARAPAAAPAPAVVAAAPATQEPAPEAAQETPPAPAVEPVAAPAEPAPPPLPPIDATTRARFDEAVRMLRANRLAEAEGAFKALAAQHPSLAGVHANLGLIYRKTGRLDESAAALEQAVKLSPKQASYYNQLGITWRALGRFDHARKAYEAAIELDSSHAGALVNLAILHDLYLGDAARAVELYTRGAALLPAEAATINKWLAEVKGRKGDPKLAGSPSAPSPASAGANVAPAGPGAAPSGTPARKEKE